MTEFINTNPAVHAGQKDWLICHECGELQKSVEVSPEYQVVCFNCGNVLHVGHGRWLDTASALAVTAFILLIACNILPFLTLEVGPHSQTATILDGVWALIEREHWLLAGAVFTTIFLFPLFEVFAFLYVLIPYKLNKRLRGQTTVLHWLIQVQSWSMLEVFMLSVVVTSVKLADMAVLVLEPGAYLFFTLVAVLLLAYFKMDRRMLWSWMNQNNYFSRDENEPLYDCRVCHAMVGESLVNGRNQCPRCYAHLHKRIPHSMQKTTALVIAATILYIPANLLPIMTYTSLGITETDTILSGVLELMIAGLYWIALVVFVASIVVPITKLIIFYYLLAAVHFKIKPGVKHRASLYRLTEIIGRWSMVDVYVVTLLVALVQFGFIYTVEAEGAIIAFAAVVILTMIAAETFDPRLLWDAVEDNDR